MSKYAALILLCLVAAVAALPAEGAPLIIATNIQPSCSGNTAVLIVTLDSTTYGFWGNSLYYHFDPPSTGVPPTTGGNPQTVQIPSTFIAGSTHTLVISDISSSTGGSSSSTYSFVVPSCRKGMTWALLATNATTGTVRVGCGGTCNATQGDTLCTTALPLLCIKKSGTGFPLPVPAAVDNTDIYNKWSGGVIATTAAMVAPSSLANANAACSTAFGTDWRLAEFHDGWGWSFQAYGGVGNPSSRVWVDINDQPNGRCW